MTDRAEAIKQIKDMLKRDEKTDHRSVILISLNRDNWSVDSVGRASDLDLLVIGTYILQTLYASGHGELGIIMQQLYEHIGKVNPEILANPDNPLGRMH